MRPNKTKLTGPSPLTFAE